MSGRKIAGFIAFLAVILAVGGGFLLWGLQQVPEFYEEVLAEQPDLKQRKVASEEFVQSTRELVETVKHSDKWSQEFTQAHVNAWLAEELHTKYSDVVPPGVREPRVKFVDDKVLVGFHYSDSKYSGIISLQLRPWMIEPNRLAVEIQSVKAGAVPVPMDEFLELINKGLTRDGWQVESSQLNGNQVLVLKFVPSEANQPVLETVKILPGKLQMAGSRAIVPSQPTGTKGINQVPRLADQSVND